MPTAGWMAVWQLRLPRVLLAEPYVPGVSSGASVGATAVLLFGSLGAAGLYALSGAAFLGALAAMVVVFAVAQHQGRVSPLRLVLAGMAMAHAFSALSSFLVFRADPRASRVVLFWLLGSFGRATWDLLLLPAFALGVDVPGPAPPVVRRRDGRLRRA